MSNWTIKTFHKSQALKAYIHLADKRMKVYWCIPDGNTITVNEKRYFINDKDFVLTGKNIPSFEYIWNVPEPINPYLNKPNYMTSDDFDTAISAKVASEIFSATQGKTSFGLFGLILSGVTLVALGVVAYLGYKEIENIKIVVEELRTILRQISGF